MRFAVAQRAARKGTRPPVNVGGDRIVCPSMLTHITKVSDDCYRATLAITCHETTIRTASAAIRKRFYYLCSIIVGRVSVCD